MSFNKFRAQRTTVDGITFASKGEASCYLHLLTLQKSGLIKILKTQVPVKLSAAKIKTVPDFYVQDLITKYEYYIEFKGCETPRWKMIKKLWESYGPCRLDVYKAKGSRIVLFETIIPKGN